MQYVVGTNMLIVFCQVYYIPELTPCTHSGSTWGCDVCRVAGGGEGAEAG